MGGQLRSQFCQFTYAGASAAENGSVASPFGCDSSIGMGLCLGEKHATAVTTCFERVGSYIVFILF